MRYRSLLFAIACFCTLALAAPKTDEQIQMQRAELKKIEASVAKSRRQLEMLKSEEKSVLNTLSLLDQNLSLTREYLNSLSENEKSVSKEVGRLNRELAALDEEIEKLKRAMGLRVRELYLQGKNSEAQVLYDLLQKHENPEKQIYLVHRLLTADKVRIETLQNVMKLRNKKKSEESSRLSELKILREKKSAEETGLKNQIGNQESMLKSLKNDQEMQKQAIAEFERNQKTMMALIKKLEEKRKKELAEAKRKKEAEEKRKKELEKQKQKQKQPEKKPPEPVKPPPAKTPEVVGPKCMPLEGQVISRYGIQDHPVLHIPVRNLGVEIRGKKGAKIKAAARGTVAMVSEIDGRGPSVIIEHAGGVYSVYGHLSATKVKEGDAVTNCQEIGTVGDVASLNGIKLYFQVSAGTDPLDPLQWLSKE